MTPKECEVGMRVTSIFTVWSNGKKFLHRGTVTGIVDDNRHRIWVLWDESSLPSVMNVWDLDPLPVLDALAELPVQDAQ